MAHKPVPPPKDLVAGLSHPYLWWRLRLQKRIVEGDREDLVGKITKLAESESRSFWQGAFLWFCGTRCLAGKNHWSSDGEWALVCQYDWAPPSGESKEFLPDEFVSGAEKVAGRQMAPSVLTSYASALGQSGYPSRAVKTYKDKEADG